MRALCLAVIPTIGCGIYGPAPNHQQPEGCAVTIEMDGFSKGLAHVGPIALDDHGVNLCVDIDATRLGYRANLLFFSDPRDGAESGLEGSLERRDHTPIEEAVDEPYGGGSAAQSVLRLESAVLPGASEAVMIWVRATAAATSRMFTIELGNAG
jgi:hypothetical protein